MQAGGHASDDSGDGQFPVLPRGTRVRRPVAVVRGDAIRLLPTSHDGTRSLRSSFRATNAPRAPLSGSAEP